MSVPRLVRALLAALFALTLVGCGDDGDDDAGVDATDDTTEDTTEGTTEDTPDDGDAAGDDVEEFLAALGDEGCASLLGLYAQVGAAFGGAGDQLEDSQEYLQNLADDAPEEIRDDFAVFAEFFQAYADALEGAGIDLSDPDASSDPAQAGQLAQVFADLSQEIDQEALEEAGDNITAWTEANCEELGGDG